MSDIMSRLKTVICEQLDIEAEQIKLEAKFTDDLGADSLDTVELIMSIEDEFDIEIGDDKAADIITVQNAVEMIESKLKESA